MAITTTEVSQTIEQLPPSPQPDQPGIRELLTQLQRVIDAEEHLDSQDKTQALAQIQALAHAWGETDREAQQEQVVTALRVLRGMIAELPHAHSFNETATSLVPQIAAIFEVKD
jgi:hypothetical protein